MLVNVCALLMKPLVRFLPWQPAGADKSAVGFMRLHNIPMHRKLWHPPGTCWASLGGHAPVSRSSFGSETHVLVAT